ncbi:ABC transporter permease (plasmid) [Halorussus salilacus]|uniref:ABC transporter permease n=1 Tax=Halorussus salilacus TaxID=2953750 RepID=UPI0020A22000|nr:ABC transporter permease [Halorussus salilacus]USZ70137.1 ABC transporter permease [Halorussus salilacus]
MATSDATDSRLDRFRDRMTPWLIGLRRTWDQFTESPLGLVGLFILAAIGFTAVFAPYLAPHSLDWQAYGGNPSFDQASSLPHPPVFGDPFFAPLGTDSMGHGILTQLIYGSRTALYIGLAAGLLSSLVGVPVGIVSGYYSDTKIDEGIQRIIDVMYGLPFLPLVIVLVFVRGVTTTNIILAIVVKSWLNNAIVIRGQVMSLSERPFVEAARASGASDLRIMGRHIVPNILPIGFVYLAQDAAFAILIQASLAFLGLADFTDISWGTMLQWIQVEGYVYTAPWWLIPPGVMIALLAASFYFIGYSLEDVMNPGGR